jgi:hypothetical protein
MYCQESPEPWFEDFGRGTLDQGRAEIALDPDFVGVVKGDDYDVFLTPYGDSKGLYVSSKGSGKFAVAEQQGGPASWRSAIAWWLGAATTSASVWRRSTSPRSRRRGPGGRFR